MLNTIISSIVITAMLASLIQLIKYHESTFPVLETRYNNQKYEYHIEYGRFTFTGYSNQKYSHEQIAIYAIERLNMTFIRKDQITIFERNN